MDFATLAHDTVNRQAVVNTVMEFWVPKKVQNFCLGYHEGLCSMQLAVLSYVAKEV